MASKDYLAWGWREVWGRGVGMARVGMLSSHLVDERVVRGKRDSEGYQSLRQVGESAHYT